MATTYIYSKAVQLGCIPSWLLLWLSHRGVMLDGGYELYSLWDDTLCTLGAVCSVSVTVGGEV